MGENRRKVFHMVTISRSISLMKGQFDHLTKKGFDMGIVSSPGKELSDIKSLNKIEVLMEREISIIKDIKSLAQLIRLFRIEKPYILNTGTPKAGLLGALASYITRVPNRVYTIRGLRLETTTGWKRKILWFSEKVTCTLSSKVICISPSLRDRAIELRLVDKSKTVIFANGSSNGINVNNYPSPIHHKEKTLKLKKGLKIKETSFVLGFVGRLTKDKGVHELIEAFIGLERENVDVKLIILGNYTSGDPISDSIKEEIETNDNIIYLGFVDDPTPYYYLFDLLIFPTYREGFGNVSIQSQAAGTPVITTNATGAVDTVVDGVTGFIIPIGRSNEIIEKVIYLKMNESERIRMGKEARSRALKDYKSEVIWNEMSDFYKSL